MSYGYQNLGATEGAINYLGISNIRDAASNPADVGPNGWWQQVANATGAKFDAFLSEGSAAQMQGDLGRAQQIAGQGILNFIEGGNEEDNPYPSSQGNSLGYTAYYQQTVNAAAHSAGVPSINMSFGAGWTAANDWHGNYDKVGDLSAYADYANAHTYPFGAPMSTINMLITDAQLAASGRPVIQTEFGYNESNVDPTQAAKWDLDGILDAYSVGIPKTYFYALFDDSSGGYGLMNQDGSARPEGQAIHDLTTLLADSGGGVNPGTLNYSLNGSGDSTMLMQKSDGTYWLAIWNENAGAHTDTLTLGSAASQIQVFDPLTGTSAIQSDGNTATVQIQVPDHPVLVEISNPGAGGTAAGATGGTSTGGTTTGRSTGGTSTGASGTPQDLSVTVPATESVATGSTTAVSGVGITDPWAAATGGTMALNVFDTSGTINIAGNTYGPGGGIVGGGMLSGTEAQLNADLASLTYTAAGTPGTDTLTVDVWNQAGVESKQTIQITAGAAGNAAPAIAASANPDVVVPATQASFSTSVSNQTVGASAGDHMIFIGGTGDTLTATGGTETVSALQGSNMLTTGAGDNSISFGGTGNVVDAGAGTNTLTDEGSNNTIVLPGAGQGTDVINGPVLQNGDQFDMRALLAGTSWTGDMSTIGSFVNTSTDANNDGIISVNATGAAGGSSTAVATLVGSGPVSLTTLLSHAVLH